MIKKIFFQSIFFNFFFLKEVFAAESGGMPQLNPEFWISQIFWLTLTFGILYIALSKLILPKISANLELRKSQIQENIEAAEKQRESSESKIKEYDQIILKSKLEAKNIFKEAREKVIKDINSKKEILANCNISSKKLNLSADICEVTKSHDIEFLGKLYSFKTAFS